MASSKECPVWVREIRVQKIKAEQGCTFPEGSYRLATAATQPATSSATIVKSNSIKTTNRTTTKSIDTHTDLTWPNETDRPTLVKSSAQSHDEQCETDKCGDVDQSALSPPTKADKPGDAHSGARRSGTRNNAGNGNKNKGPRIKRPPDPVTTNN